MGFARWPEGPQTSRTALRSPGKKFDAATIAAEFKRGGIVYDETRIVSNIGEGIRIVTLSDVPAYGVYADDEGIYSTYDEYKLRVTLLTENGSTRILGLRKFNPDDRSDGRG